MARAALTPEQIEKLRRWNDHPGNRGRDVGGDNRMPYGDDALRRTVNRWQQEHGSFLVEAFLRDVSNGAPTVPVAPPPIVEPADELPADDPRLRRMWAGIARNALTSGTSGHYDTISRELGAPSAKVLEEEGWLRQTVFHSVYRFLDVEEVRSPGVRTGRATGAGIRAATLRMLEEHDDDWLAANFTHNASRSEWTVQEPAAPAVDEAAAVAEGEENGERGEDRADRPAGAGGGAGGDGAGSDGERVPEPANA